jgi:hypothetical protein
MIDAASFGWTQDGPRIMKLLYFYYTIGVRMGVKINIPFLHFSSNQLHNQEISNDKNETGEHSSDEN